MTKYKALPIEVTAHEIFSVPSTKDKDGSMPLALKNGENVTASPEMLARMTPQPGDYWVIQPDGYIYINPKSVFEGKYEPLEQIEKSAA